MAAAHWEQFNLAGEVLPAAAIMLSVDGDKNDCGDFDTYKVAYDNNGANASWYQQQAYCSENDPWDFPEPDGTTRDYSIFVNYDIVISGGGGAGAVVMGTKSLILDLLLEGVID